MRGILRPATAAIPPVMGAIAVGYGLATQQWSRWGVEAMAPMTPASTSFADLANITATAQCLRDGTDYTVCDPYGRAFQPYVVLPARVLAALGLGTDATGTLGILLAATLIATLLALGWYLQGAWRAGTPALVAAQVLLGLAAVTAPVMLAVERGQIEQLTLALTVAALLALSARGRGVQVAGAAAGVIAVVSKFFAVGLFAPFVRRGRPAWPALAGLAVSAAFLVLSWSDLQQASAAARADLPATSKSQFGAALLVATLHTSEPVSYVPDPGIAEQWDRVRLIGWGVTLVAVVVATVLLPGAAVDGLARQARAHALIVGGAGVLAVPYVLGASHDYRMVFLLPVLAGALAWLGSAEGRDRWVPWAIVVGSVLALVTGAAMVPTPEGFLWGRTAMVAGDLGLLAVLALAAGIWIRGWLRRA